MQVDPVAAGFDPARLARVGEHLQRSYLAPGKIAGCQILVKRRGAVALRASLGRMDLERDRPMADDAIFRIYSMTKPITSVALMMLFEEGRFQLDDPVSKALPAWRDLQVWESGEGAAMRTRPPREPPTFRHLLSHTGGLTYGAMLASLGGPGAEHPVDQAYERAGIARSPGRTLEDLVDRLAGVPLRYEPGERWMYSLSTDVCARLVEVLSGRRFDAFLRERLFEPLGMADTGFHVPPDKAPRFASNYRRTPAKTLQAIDDARSSPFLNEPSYLGGGGGLVSTLEDYGRFCDMLLQGGAFEGRRVLGSRTLGLMTRNHLRDGRDLTAMALGSFSETANRGVGFGLGFATTLDEVAAGSLGAGDFYWGGAASTLFWVDPREDLLVVFLTQLMPSGTFNFRGQLKSILYSAFRD